MGPRLARPLVALLVAAVLACALTPAGALADGDPASDMLLVQKVFYPYQPQVSRALQGALNAETAAAAKAGVPIRVAIIASPIDLGAIPSLFGKPQAYANFLDREISFNGPQPLLVVMAAGYGLQGMHAGLTPAAAGLSAPIGRTGDDLAQSAIGAVAKLAAAAGHPIKSPAGAGATAKGGNSPLTILLGLIVAAGFIAATILTVRRHWAHARRPTARDTRGGRRL